MLSPEYLAHCADDIVSLYGKLEDYILRDIVRRILKTGRVTDTAKWQIDRLQEQGVLYNDIITEIANVTGTADTAVTALFNDAGVKAVEYDNAIYEMAGLSPLPLKQSPAMASVLQAGLEKTKGNIQNLTLTTANTAQTAYIQAATFAEMQIESGASDYAAAIKNAALNASKQGATVLYPSGHIDKIDVAIRRAVMTGVSQTAGQLSLRNAESLGWDLMEITAHTGARPSHAVWQGGIVSLSGRRGYLSQSDIGYGSGDGFKGWNCRHDWYPYYEGTGRAYTDRELKNIDAAKVIYNETEYSEYEAEQMQRQFERKIRAIKRDLTALDELMQKGNKDIVETAKIDFDTKSVKLKEQEAKLEDLVKQTGLMQDKTRTQVQGFGRSTAQKAVWANRRKK